MNIKRLLKIILNIIFYCIIAVLLFLSATMIYATAQGKQPEILGYKFYAVLSGSMEPAIETGDLIMVKDISSDDVAVGDVITFQTPNTDNIVTHRVTEIINDNETEFKTKGDANNVEDNTLVNTSSLKGRFVKKFHGVGYVVSYIEQNIIRIFITLAVLIIASIVVDKVVKELIKNKKSKLIS